MRPIDNYFLQLEEPYKSMLQFLRDHILRSDAAMEERWQYGMPFYYYKDKRICYCWVHKKLKQPYLGIVEGNKNHHPELVQEKRARMKIFLLDPAKDMPVKKIKQILATAISFYK